MTESIENRELRGIRDWLEVGRGPLEQPFLGIPRDRGGKHSFIGEQLQFFL